MAKAKVSALQKEVTLFCSVVAKTEGKKSQAKMGDVREIFGIMADLEEETGGDVTLLLQAYAADRANKKAKKVK